MTDGWGTDAARLPGVPDLTYSSLAVPASYQTPHAALATVWNNPSYRNDIDQVSVSVGISCTITEMFIFRCTRSAVGGGGRRIKKTVVARRGIMWKTIAESKIILILCSPQNAVACQNANKSAISVNYTSNYTEIYPILISSSSIFLTENFI